MPSVSREAPASLRVRITGNDIPAILTKLTARRDFLAFRADPRKMRYKEKKEKRESQGSGFDSQGCEGMAPLSLAVRSRSRDLKVLSCLSAERKRERESTRA